MLLVLGHNLKSGILDLVLENYLAPIMENKKRKPTQIINNNNNNQVFIGLSEVNYMDPRYWAQSPTISLSIFK